MNGRMWPQNTSGYKGVSWVKSVGKWESYVKTNGRKKFLGHFADLGEAVEATRLAREKFHGEFANHG